MLTTSPATMRLTELRPRVDVDERLSRVDRHPHIESAVLDDGVADRQRGTYRPLRVILVHDRCAEDRHDGIADELLHRAATLLQLCA